MVNTKFLVLAAAVATGALALGEEGYEYDGGKGPDGKGPDGKGPDGKGPDGKGPGGKGPDGKGPKVPAWTTTYSAAVWDPTPVLDCKGWEEKYECDEEDGSVSYETWTVYNKGCPGWVDPKDYPRKKKTTNVWDPIKKTTTTSAYGWGVVTTTTPDPWATWTTKWTKPTGKPGKPWDPKDDDEDCDDWDVYEWDDGKPWWGKNKDGKPWYPKDKDGKPWYPKNTGASEWSGDYDWDSYNVWDHGKSWWGKNKDGKPWYPKDKDGKPWYPKNTEGKPWDPKDGKPWDGKNWVTTKWEDVKVVDPKKWGKKVVVITLTETWKVPCSTGWTDKTTVWYTTHCGCTETPVPVHPPMSTYTTECPESWGVGKTVTVIVPKPVDPVTTWATWVDPSSTWATWVKPTSTYTESWSVVTGTPVKATGVAPWTPVATYKGAAVSSAVSKAMVIAAGAFAGLAFLL